MEGAPLDPFVIIFIQFLGTGIIDRNYWLAPPPLQLAPLIWEIMDRLLICNRLWLACWPIEFNNTRCTISLTEKQGTVRDAILNTHLVLLYF